MLTWEDEERKVRKVQRPSGGRALFGRQFDSRPEQIEIWGPTRIQQYYFVILKYTSLGYPALPGMIQMRF